MKNEKNLNAFLIALFLFAPSFATIPKLFLDNRLIDFSGYIFYILIFITSITLNKFLINKKYFWFLLITNILFLINLLIVSSYKDLVMEIYLKFNILAIIAVYITSLDIDYKKLVKYWYILGVLNILIWLPLLNLISSEEISYMHMGTFMTLAFAIVYYNFLRKRKLIDLFWVIVSFTMIAVFANRGALLAIAVLAISILFYRTKYKKTVFTLSAISIILFLLLDIKSIALKIVNNLNNLLINNGINSYPIKRLIDTLNSGVVESSSGRDNIFDYSLDILKESFHPHGVGYFEHVTNILYPHNLFLDLFIIFGYLAIPILFLCIFFTFKVIVYEENKVKKEIIVMLITILFIRLNLSSTFLDEASFWILFGIILNTNNFKKNTTIANQPFHNLETLYKGTLK